MLAQNGVHLNGHTLNGKATYSPCSSDYEPAPTIDITPFKPIPKWRDQFPSFTHVIKWLDSDGCEQSLTLRSDSLADLMNDLRLIKSMIKQSRQQHSSDDTPSQPEEASLAKPCEFHNSTPMKRRNSKAGGHFYSHRLADGTWCNGRERK